MAATFYLEPVPTMDVDIFVAIHANTRGLIITPSPIYEYLSGRGYKAVGEALKIEDWLVQFLRPRPSRSFVLAPLWHGAQSCISLAK